MGREGRTLLTKFSFKAGNPFPEAMQLISPYASQSRTQPSYLATPTCKGGLESEYLVFPVCVVGERFFQWERSGGAWTSVRQPPSSRTTICPRFILLASPQEHLQLAILLPLTWEVTPWFILRCRLVPSAPLHTAGEMTTWVVAHLSHKMECDL